MPAGCRGCCGEYMTADNTPIAARNIKAGGSVMKGYYASDLARRVAALLPTPRGKCATSATSATGQVRGRIPGSG